MNPAFVDVMNRKFPDQFTVEASESNTAIVFAPKHADFGEVAVFEDGPGSYIVEIGKFTHNHYDCYQGTDEEMAREAAEEICGFLEDLFADRIVCYGAHQTGGGWYRKESGEQVDWAGLHVWSGIYHADR